MTTHELRPIFADHDGGDILDFAFISDENFLLLVALTSKGNVITHHRSNHQQQTCSCVSLFDVHPEFCEPVLVALSPDASEVILLLANDSILLIPIRCLINVTWGDQNNAKPVEFAVESNVNSRYRLPTSVACFNSVHNSRTYVVYSNKAGFLNIVDIEIRRLIVSMSTNEQIDRLEVYSAPDSLDLWLIVSHVSGRQSVMQIESTELPLRENLAHNVPDENIEQLDEVVTAINAENKLTLYSPQKKTLSLLEGLVGRIALTSFVVPPNCWRTYLAPRLLACVTTDFVLHCSLPFTETHEFQQVGFPQQKFPFESMDCQPKVLGFVPISRSDSDLDRTLVVSSTGLFMLTPVMPFPNLTLTQLIQTDFSKTVFMSFCKCTKKEPFVFYESIFRDVVKSRPPNSTEIVKGLIRLAVEMDFELGKLSALANELGEYEVLIPHLALRCEKETEDTGVRQLLFETYMHKLWKLDSNSAEKSKLEREIRFKPTTRFDGMFSFSSFLIKYNSSVEVIHVLLKHSLLSCSLVLLQRNPTAVSPHLTSFLLEQTKWSNFDGMDLLRTIDGLDWSTLDNTAKRLLCRKLMQHVGVNSSPPLHELGFLVDVAGRLLRAEPLIAGPLFTLTVIKVLPSISALRKPSEWKPVGFGSNCALIVGDDRRLWAWGEFKGGNLRTQTKNERQTDEVKRSDSRKRLRDNSTDEAETKTLPLFNLTITPYELMTPADWTSNSMGFSSVVCGTEHVLLLSSCGRLFSYGKNRFGQCGVGHTNPVTRLTELCGLFARPRSIFAGHYHSALLDTNNDVWLWGWSVHGQLATDTVSNLVVPTKIDVLSSLNVKSISLGMAHSLFLTHDGWVFGCGFMDNGELLVDPHKIPACGGRSKSWRLIRLAFPEPIELLACGYFVGAAMSKTALYEWGISPQALRMNAFWQKRKNAKFRPKQKSEETSGPSTPDPLSSAETLKVGTNLNDPLMTPMRSATSRDHFKLRRLCSWDLNAQPVRQLTVGYNHAAILTTSGRIHTWGRSLDRQLGHELKADKPTPFELTKPDGVLWSHIYCGRNTTIAVSDRGHVFVWGRNDREQLGVPSTNKSPSQSANGTPKRYTLKSGSSNKKRQIEVPVSPCVDKPTVVAGIHCGVHQEVFLQPDLEDQLCVLLDSCDQSTLQVVAQQLRLTPVCSPLAIGVQFMAGDLFYGLDNLAAFYAANRPQMQCETNELRRAQDGTSRTEKIREFVEPNHNNLLLTQPTTVDDPANGNSSTSANLLNPTGRPTTTTVDSSVTCFDVEEFERLVDQAWQLMNSHPLEDVRTVGALTMLCARLPCYTRLSADARLCRLVAAHVELPQPNSLTSSSTTNRKHANSSTSSSVRNDALSASVDFCTSATSNRHRMSELKTARERAAALRRARCPGPSKLAALRQRAEQLADRFDYFAACGHFERRVVEANARRAQLHRQQNSHRRCSQCVPKIVAPLPPIIPGVLSPRSS